MKTLLMFIVSAMVSLHGVRADEATLAEPLKPFAPFLNKTWKGEFKESTPEKPMFDVSHWERALNGQAIRVLHSVNDGMYGGETIIYWDAQKKLVTFYYFTTAGFFTNGTMSIEGNRMTGHEMVTGNQNGITEVKSASELLPDGSMRTSASFLQNGQWVEGHEILYKEDPAAQVIFK